MAIFRTTFASDAMFREVAINVILPLEAPQIPGMPPVVKPEKFKTLYLLHGFSGNHNDWLEYAGIRELAAANDLAIVMPAAENSWYLDSGVMGSNYMSMVAEDVVSFTRKVFPLSGKREDTFIGGLSMGGYGALRIGCLYPDTFGKVVSLSGAFITDTIAGQKPGYRDVIADYDYYVRTFGDLNKLKGTEKDPLYCVDEAKAAGKLPGMYFAIGQEDFLLEPNRAMKAALEQRGIAFRYKESEGIHDWNFWRREIGPAVQWLLAEESEEIK